MDKTNKIILFCSFIVIIIIVLLFTFIPRKSKTTIVTKIKHVTDTVVVCKKDTVYNETVIFYPGKIDTLFIFNETDSLLISGITRDTVYIDSLSLTLITRDTTIKDTCFIETLIKQETIKKQRFTFGINAGVGCTYGVLNKKLDVGPTISFGVNYNF